MQVARLLIRAVNGLLMIGMRPTMQFQWDIE
jgi:hypothetical protein